MTLSRPILRGLLVLALATLPSLAFGQSTPVFQSGPMIAPHDIAKITRNGQVQDAGGLLGDALGRGLNPFSVHDNLGLGLSFNSANTGSAYSSFSFGHDASGNGVIDYVGSGGVKLRINGSETTLPGSASCLGCGTMAGQNAAGITLSMFLTDGSSVPPSVAQILDITAAGPGGSSYTGVKDYMRISIGNFPMTSEFGADGSAQIGAVNGLMSGIVQPGNVSSTVTAWFGITGACLENTDVGLAGSCTGVAGYGLAQGNAALFAGQAVGVTAGVSNAAKITAAATRTGFEGMNLSGIEVNTNNMKLSNGAAPKANVVGISFIGVSEVAPSTGSTDCHGGPCLLDAMFVQPPGFIAAIPWINALHVNDGSATNILKAGAVCQATLQCSSQAIKLDAYTAAGAGNLVEGTIQLSGGGSGTMVVNGPGQVALQVNGTNVLTTTASAVTSAQPLTVASIIGGAATNSALSLKSTSNGAPSGDAVSLLGSTTNIGSTDGLTAFATFTSTRIDLAKPVRFPASTSGAVTPAFTNAPTGCSTVVWLGPFETTSPVQTGVFVPACHS